MAFYVLTEDGFKLVLEDNSGSLLLEDESSTPLPILARSVFTRNFTMVFGRVN